MWRWLAGLLLAAVLAALFGLAVLVGTGAGAAWLAGQAEALTGGAVALRGVSGSLVGGLAAESLAVRTDGAIVQGTGVRLRLAPADLLRGRLRIVAVAADALDVELVDDGRPPEPFRMPAVATPLPVDLDGLDVATLRVRLDGAERVAVTGIRLAATLEASRLTVREARAALAGVELALEGAADLVPELPLEARLRWSVPAAGVAGEGPVEGNLAALSARQRVSVPEPVDVELRLEGLATTPRLAASAAWAAVVRDVPGAGPVRVTEGRVEAAGWLEDWRATLAAGVEVEGFPAARARADLAGNLEGATIRELALDGAFGSVAARGTAAFAPPALELAVTARDVRTEVLRKGLAGRLAADFTLAVDADGRVAARVARLDGRLMGRPLSGSGAFAWSAGELRLDKVVLRAGANRLDANGVVGERLDGRFALEAPQLEVLWPGLAGRLSARGTLAGTLARPQVDVTASGAGLGLDGNRVEAFDLDLDVDRRQRVTAELRLRGARAGETAIGDLDARVDGTLADHRLEARLADGVVDAALESTGAWDGRALRHRLLAARVAEATAGEWRLDGTPDVVAAADRVTAGPHCWRQDPAQLCIDRLEWTPAAAALRGELANVELTALDRWMPEDLAVTGTARATVDLTLGADGPAGTVAAALADAVVYYTGGEEPLVTPLEEARLDAVLGPEGARASLVLAGGETLRFNAEGTMRPPLGATAELDARLEGEIPDISPLVPLFAADVDLAEVAGRIVLDASVGGTLAEPQITGVVRLTGGAAALTDVGVKFEGVDIALLGDGSDTLRLQGSARAGGALTLAGEARPLAEGGPTAWFRVRGNRVDLVRLPDRLVQTSPDVTVRYDAGRLSAEGSVTIPKAEIIVRELPESAASPSRDTVVHGREAQADAAGAQAIGGEVALVLGRDVRLQAFGLDTRLEGTVRLSQAENGEPRGYGTVRLKDGKFGAYGKELTIERGSLGFSGPLDDPAIDLRASRRIEWEGRSVTAGLLVRGTTTRPESRVFSEPAMSEADALSYLISGRPLQSANANDRSAIAGAALSLGVQQTSPLTERIGSAVTLDEFGLEGGTLDETEVVAGKQLNDDLYLRFTYGLFNRIGTVLARYRLSRSLSLEAASGEDQSLDLVWSVEKE